MRKIPLLIALLIGTLLAPTAALAAESASIRAILITASPKKGESDRRLARYEGTLRQVLPGSFQSFRFVGEGSASLPIPGNASVSLGRGHRLELEGERAGGRDVRMSARWLSGGNELMNQPLRASRGTPTVMGGPSAGGDGEVWAVLIIAN